MYDCYLRNQAGKSNFSRGVRQVPGLANVADTADTCSCVAY